MLAKLVEVFTGRSGTEPVTITVKNGERKAKVSVMFGTIVIHKKIEKIPEGIEEEHGCKIHLKGDRVVIVPDVVYVVLENRGVLASCLQEDTTSLEEWFEKNGAALLKKLI